MSVNLETGELNLLGDIKTEGEQLDDLFSEDAKASVAREQMIAAAREILGLGPEPIGWIETKEQLDERLLQRLQIAAAFVSARDAMRQHASALEAWDKIFEPQVQTYMFANPPAKGKTLTPTYGTLATRSVPESISLDPNDQNQKLLQEKLANLSADDAAKFKVRAVQKTEWTRDLESIKKHLMEQHAVRLMEWKAEKPEERGPKPLPIVWQGLKFSPKHESFSIKHSGINL